MPKFHYKAARNDGQIVEGQIEAADRDRVARMLQTQGNIPIQIELAGAPAAATAASVASHASTNLLRRGKVTDATVDFFTLELATLLRAGLPLAQALDTLAELAEDAAMADMTQEINKSVRGGKSLSEALERSDQFDHFYCNMVRAGESSGALDLALERLASFRAGRRELRQSLISALIYPAILLILAICAVAVMLAFVVPQFTQMFADAGRELPLLTRIVAGAGDLVTNWWWAILLGIGGLVWWLRHDWSTPSGRNRWDTWMLRSRLVGPLLQKLHTARFTRTLATLLENGVNLVPAMEISRQIVGNVVMSQALTRAAQRVREGAGLSGPLAETQVFPPLASQLIRVGESTGRLEVMLSQVADIYERDVQTSMKRLLTLAEPIIIITIAILISLIILSVVLMILDSNDLAF